MAEENTQYDLGRLEGLLSGVQDQLKALVSRFDKLEDGFDQKIEKVDAKATDAHVRISRIEKRLGYYAGAAGVVAFILTNLPGWLGYLLK